MFNSISSVISKHYGIALNILLGFLIIIAITSFFGYQRGVAKIEEQQEEINLMLEEVGKLSSRLEYERENHEFEITSLESQIEEIQVHKDLEMERLLKLSEIIKGGGDEGSKDFLSTTIPSDVKRLLDK